MIGGKLTTTSAATEVGRMLQMFRAADITRHNILSTSQKGSRMPYERINSAKPCKICGAFCNERGEDVNGLLRIDCSKCGDYKITREDLEDVGGIRTSPIFQALASHTIRKLRQQRPLVDLQFLQALVGRALPSPMENCNNFLLYLATASEGRVGRQLSITYDDPENFAQAGVVDAEDIGWVVHTLKSQGFIETAETMGAAIARITARGWQRVDDLRHARVSSSFAFFARKFENAALDQAYTTCLRPAVNETGYELLPATQRAGLIDAVIEDEIRRCRFVLVDLTDENPGAYWEAGFAEGLGKDVIYTCQMKNGALIRPVHFDANHRQTVPWNLDALDETATKLKAVIRNTLLGDAVTA